MQKVVSFPLTWLDPPVYARYLNDLYHGQDFAFLFSAKSTGYSRNYSYIAFEAVESITDIAKWKSLYKTRLWFGYLGYEAFNNTTVRNQFIQSPDLHVVSFNKVIEFDHTKKLCMLRIYYPDAEEMNPEYGKNITLNAQRFVFYSKPTPEIKFIYSNMDNDQHKRIIQETIEAMCAGEFYQANITRKFYGYLQNRDTRDDLSTFLKLCQINPNPYGSFLKLGNNTIMSASPEMFLKVDTDGFMTTVPIKGTSLAYDDPIKNNQSRQWLVESKKNFAENLMIVDLMRNDLARNCVPGSITVPTLYKVCTYPNLHHAISIVNGYIHPSKTIYDLLSSCMPPGSITGAPKARVIEWCNSTEKMSRGIYSGCIGWFDGPNNKLDTAVAIRTLIISVKDQWEFQAGGGILAKSDPEEELIEALAKAQPVFRLLNLSAKMIQ